MSIFDVTAEDITRLSDSLLADLLGRLVEAEATKHGIPLNTVVHGGHGNAPDRGTDARVSWPGEPEHTDFFPRRATVFQSKAETMSAAPLKDEMAPGGEPRPLFKELAEVDGAYVMFCGKDNCNDKMLADRKSAMRSAVSSATRAIDSLSTSMTQAGLHAGLMHGPAWLHGCATGLVDRLQDGGRTSRGRRPGASEQLPYLTDETSRASFTFDEEAPQVRILEALARVRSDLTRAGRSVRLVGLSGTGKTRFAEVTCSPKTGS